MMGIGFPELMIILVIIMIIFGAGKLPEIGSAFGRSIKNFKSSMKEAEEADGEAETAATASADGDAESESAPASATTTSTPATVSQKTATPTEAVSPKTTTTTAKKNTGLSAEDQKEQDIIDQAIKELEGKRIDTIKTRHDGLVQESDVFTESLKRTPFGRGRDRGVQRDVF
jgi:sec-independent protein translocase protein TatA